MFAHLDLCLPQQAVLADGTIVDTMSTCRKDNTGYDLKQLFIGSEGTLGIVTGVVLHAPQMPKSTNVAFLGVSSFERVQQVLTYAKQYLGEILSGEMIIQALGHFKIVLTIYCIFFVSSGHTLSACEFMDNQAMQVSQKNLSSSNPLGTPSPFYVLLETQGSNSRYFITCPFSSRRKSIRQL